MNGGGGRKGGEAERELRTVAAMEQEGWGEEWALSY